jgi:hypothetical protein
MPQFPLDQSDAQLVAEACSRAAQVLGLSPKELSEVLSMNQPNADDKDLVPQSREGQPALLFLRVYRSLHGLCGGDQSLMRHWIEQPNRHLGEQSPRLLLARIEGLNCVADYLDSFFH